MSSPLRLSSSSVCLSFPSLPLLSSSWRHLGYSRQQWSNFYCDQYVTEPFVGIVDSDATFTRTPLPGDLFDQQNRPVMYWYNARSPWCAAADYLIGQPCIGEFMINFPVVVNTTHFALMRAHIAAHLQVPFDEAWARMLNRYAEYSQFDVMATYLSGHEPRREGDTPGRGRKGERRREGGAGETSGADKRPGAEVATCASHVCAAVVSLSLSSVSWWHHRDSYSWRINSCGPACRHPTRPELMFPLDSPTGRDMAPFDRPFPSS